MGELFRIGDAEHELWLSRGPEGFRLHSDAGDAAVSLSEAACVVRDATLRSAPHHDEDVLQPTPPRHPEERPQGASRRTQAAGCNTYSLTIDGQARTLHIAPLGDRIFIHLDGAAYEVAYIDPVARHAADAAGSAADIARAPMPGAVVAAPVQPGDVVEIGDVLMIIESMKLETAIKAWRAGTVETLHVAVGASFDRDAALVTLASLKEA